MTDYGTPQYPDDYPQDLISTHRTSDHVRPLPLAVADATVPIVPASVSSLTDDDPVWTLVTAAREQGFGGVVIAGPPGTSKSWYAEQIARKLTRGDESRSRFVQFHPSYQYEDFVQGYVPRDGTFVPVLKHLMLLAEAAGKSDELHVLVIDELSRADPARVFGEALTYIEQSKRGKVFQLASGDSACIPPNVFIVATMNEWDRGVDEVDAAFDRRLARIALEPSELMLRKFLAESHMPPELIERVAVFFNTLRTHSNQAAHVGQTYFIGLRTRTDLDLRWQLQLSHVLRKAFRMDRQGWQSIDRAWRTVITGGASAIDQVTDGASPEAMPADGPQPVE
jgi:5-methylcytosine-specific restriction protein B